MAVTELTRDRWVIFKLGYYFWGTVLGETRFTEPRCSSGKYRSFQMQINETMQLKNNFVLKEHVPYPVQKFPEIVNSVTMKKHDKTV